MIDLRRLQVLRVLHHRGTVTATADALYLTPSAVSQQLRQLSREVGVELLEHEGRRVRLSAAAHTLLGHADEIFAQWQRAEADLAAHAGGGIGELRMCGFASGIDSLLAPAAALLAEWYSGLTVRLAEVDVVECQQLLLTEQTDIAVLPVPGSPPMDDPRFEQDVLLDDPQDLVVPMRHPLAEEDSVALARLAREPWVAPHHDQYELIRVACAAAGFTPRVTSRAEEWNAALSLVAHGFGVCLLPRLAPMPAGWSLRRIPLRGHPAPSRCIVTCVRRGSGEHSAIAHGLRALTAISTERTNTGGPAT